MSEPMAVTSHPVFGRRDPDARGYFGAYGGEVRARDAGGADRGTGSRLPASAPGCEVRRGVRTAADRVRRTPDTDDGGEATDGGGGRRVDLAQTGGPRAYRGTQDQ